MTDERYKAIMAGLGMPESRSLLAALKQVANEVGQAVEAAERARLASPSANAEREGMRALRGEWRTVSGKESREQARACWDAMFAEMTR